MDIDSSAKAMISIIVAVLQHITSLFLGLMNRHHRFVVDLSDVSTNAQKLPLSL